MLHSYDPQYLWTQEIMQGMLEGLGPQASDISLHVEYLDTKRYRDAWYREKFLTEILRYKLKGQHFDLILVSDNDALDFVKARREELFARIPVVFCGINAYTPGLLEGLAPVTGVAEVVSFETTVKMALAFHPGTARIIIIGNQENLTDRLNRKLMEQFIRGFETEAEFSFWDGLPLEELRRRVREMPRDHLLMVTSTAFYNKQGLPLMFSQALESLREVSSVPMYGFWEFYVGHGIVGGELVSARQQGRQAAGMALKLLAGQAITNIPVIEPGNENVFDWRELMRFGIQEDRLPRPYRLLHKPSPFYELESRTYWGGLALLAGLFVVVIMLLNNVFARRRAQASLAALSHFQQTVLDAIPVPLYYKSTEGIYLGINHAGEEFFGLPASRIIGHTAFEVFPESFAAFVQSSDEELLRRQGVQTFSTAVADSSGKLRDLLFHKTTFQGPEGKLAGIVGTMLDVTDLKLAQVEIRQRERKYATLFATSIDGLTILNAKGYFEDANDAFNEMTGYAMAELAGMRWKELLSPGNNMADIEKYIAQLMERGYTDEIELEFLRRDGKTLPVRIRTWVDEEENSDHPKRFLSVVRDVTEQNKIEKLKEEMLSMVSHEMRTPLTAMLGFTEFLLENEGLEPAMRRRSLKTIHDETLRLKDLIDNLLNLQRLRSGRELYQFHSLDLKPMLHEAQQLFAHSSQRHRIVLDLPSDPLDVRGDENKVKQVLRNLLSNAVKYSPEGGAVTLGARKRKEDVLVWVRDEGIGIEEEALPQIFDSFYRVDNSDSRRIGGTGLGLALVREVIKAHGGRIWVKSTPGKGSTFCFTLPPKAQPS